MYKILKVNIITGLTEDTFKRYDDYLRALGEAECMQYGDDIHEYIVEKEMGTPERRIIGMSYVYYKSHYEFSNDYLNNDELAMVALDMADNSMPEFILDYFAEMVWDDIEYDDDDCIFKANFSVK